VPGFKRKSEAEWCKPHLESADKQRQAVTAGALLRAVGGREHNEPADFFQDLQAWEESVQIYKKKGAAWEHNVNCVQLPHG